MEFLFFIFFAVASLQGIQSDDVSSLYNDAIMLLQNSQYEEALIYFDKILSIDENNSDALSDKSAVLIKLKRFDEALESLNKALAIKPDFVEALNNKAILMYEKGNYGEASNVLIEAWNLEPNNLVTLRNISKIIDSIPSIREVGYVKIEVRDKDNRMVGYTQAYDYLIKYPFGQSILEKNGWVDVEIKGQKLQKSVNQWEFDLHNTGLYAKTDITNPIGMFNVIEIVHDGILTTEGDYAIVTLELLRER